MLANKYAAILVAEVMRWFWTGVQDTLFEAPRSDYIEWPYAQAAYAEGREAAEEDFIWGGEDHFPKVVFVVARHAAMGTPMCRPYCDDDSLASLYEYVRAEARQRAKACEVAAVI